MAHAVLRLSALGDEQLWAGVIVEPSYCFHGLTFTDVFGPGNNSVEGEEWVMS